MRKQGSQRLTIPAPDELRADIRRQAEQLRAKRKLLKLAEAAQAANLSLTDASDRQEGGNGAK
jgi:hypothetical protein